MRKKSFIIVLLVLVMSLSIFACAGGGSHNGGSGDYKFDDYTDFTGDDTSPKLELDEGMTLDGKFDETAWAEADNTLTATSSHSTEEEPLVMNVTTHFGEKALYFAFDITDNTIFVNTGRRQSRNTGVELYLSSIDNFTFGNGAISVRVTPDGKGGGLIGYYIPSGNAWSETTAKGKYAAATYIDGEINSRNGAKGYTVELALSYDLIGGKTNAVQYTASFIQSRVLERDERLDNTFLKGTSYLQPGSWIGVTENSIIRGDEKYNFLDENYVVTDADMTVDGKLDDANWQTLIAEGKGKAITHKASGITLTTYVHFGENGVYIGLDSDAKEVWYNAERATKYNTGAEVFISALGNTVLSSDTALQFRFAVGGNSLRYRANPNAVYPYTSAYVPAKIAGSVKNGGEFNKAVDTENGYNGVDGWQGEIFVPWSAFGATTPEQKSQIAVYNNLYLSKGDAAYNNDTEARADGWSYLAPAEQKVWGNGSAEVNPQKSFFRFTKNDGFVFCGVEVPDAVMLKNADGTFTATLSPRYIDAVTSSAFTTETKEIVGGTFGVPGVPEITADAFTQNEDGSFTMTVSEDAAKKLIGGKQAVFRTDDIEAYFNIEYIDVDSSRFDAGRVKAYINFNGGIDNIIGDGTTFVGRGTPELVKYGTGSAINGYYAANMKKGSVKLNETVGTGSFTMSAMVNGDDIKNYIKSETEGGYAFIIFGTGNVDGNNGFSLRVRKDTLQVKFLGQRNRHDAVLMNVSGWQRWTFLVDRETAGELTYTLYLDNNKVIEKTISLASDVSLDVEGYNTIGIGAPGCNLDGDGTGGDYTDKSIGLDEYVYMAGTFDSKDMLDMIAWANEANAKYAFSTDNVVFDFNDVTESGYAQQLRVVAYPEDGSASVNVTDVTFGAEIADYITRAEGADYFTLSIPADKADEFRAGVRATYTYKGVTRTFTVKYIALEKLYLDVTEISVWKKNKVGDNYVFTVRVYGDSEHNTIVTGANFGEWNGYATDKGEGVYELTVPANVVEGLSSVKNITVSKGNATAADFNFEYKSFTDAEIAAIASSAEAYYDFNGNVTDRIGNAKTAAVKGSVAYNDENTALKLTTNVNTVGANIALGTGDFTMSFDAKIYSEFFNGNAGYELVSSGVDVGNSKATDVFQFSAHGDRGVLRIQIGDNVPNFYYNNTKGKLNLDNWQRFTFVVERGLPCDDETQETVRTTLYLDGVMIESKTRLMPKGAVLGNGTLYFGGNTTWTPGKTSEIDNFTFARRALTAREIEGIDSYYEEIATAAGWHVDNVTFDFTEVTDNAPFTTAVNFTTNGSGAVTSGATFTGLPEGVEITESEGAYTLNVPYAKLGELRSGVTVTATIGGVKRTFVVKYVALEKLYLDKTYVPMWLKNKSSDDTYKFNIGVYADSAHTIAVEGVTFDRWNSSVTYDSASKTYAFSAPASDVENMTSAVTVTASKGDAETAEFEFEYKYLTAAEIADIANNAEAYIDFDNGKVIDKIQNKAYVVADREAANIVDGAKYAGDKYFAANQKRTSVKLATTLGTDSFTVSMLVNGADVRKYALDDYLNGVPGAKAGYAFVLVGTGNVDGNSGFSVRVRSNTFQVKIGSTRKDHNAQLNKITGDWQRWTMTFDRSTEGTVKYAIYIDGVQVVNDSVAYEGSFDVSGFNTLGIGAPGCNLDGDGTGGGYTDKSIGLDDFMFVRKALSDKQIEGLDSYYGDVLKSVGWYVDNVAFDFTDVATLPEGTPFATDVNFTTNGSGAVTTGATFTGLPEGVNISENAGVYTLTVPTDKLDEFKEAVTVTAKIGDVERKFTIKYSPLDKLYLDKTSVSMWKKEKTATDNTYKFTVGVYADSEHTIGLDGVTFDKWNDRVTYSGNGIYTFSVLASDVEGLTSVQNIVASRGEGVTTAEFEFEYLHITQDEINAIAKDAKAYIDFDGDVTDAIGSNASVARGTATYGDATKYEGDKYFAANQKNTSVKLATTLGTGSFTVSMLVNGADIKSYANSGYAFVLVGTGNVDGNSGFSVRVRSNTFQVKIGSTRKDHNAQLNKITGDWQRWTMTFDRSTEGTVKYAIYIDGVQVVNDSVAYEGAFDVSGFNTLGIGAPGCNLDGDGTGGGYTNMAIGIDDFMLINRVITANEMEALDSYYNEIAAAAGWSVNDVTVKFDEVTAGENKTVTLGFTKYATDAITTGAMFTGLPEGVTISETAGVYTLTIPYAQLANLKNGVTVTAKIGSVERTFTIKYVPLEKLYVSTVNFYEYEIDGGGNVTKSVRVSADEQGTVGIAEASFDGLPTGVTYVAGATAGDYVFTVPVDKINDFVAAKVTVTYDGVTANVNIVYTAAILKDTEVYSNIDTVSTKSSNKQGGQVFTGIDLGTDSFTVAFMADNLNKIASGGGGYILFSTGNTDVSKGINVYANSDKFRFRCAGVSGNFPIAHNLAQYTDWTHLAFTFDRSEAGKLTITAYVNYVKVGSVTKVLTADETFTYGDSKNFVVGSINGEMWAESGAMAQTNQYNLSAAGVTIYRGVAPIDAVRTYFDGYLGGMTIPADAVQAKFTFADGTTANSVADSSVTMTKNENATETVVEGKDGGDDKAIKINSKSAYYDVNGFDVSTGSFAVSMDLKMDFSTALNSNGSGIVLFATTDPGATEGFAVSIRQNTIRVQINGSANFLTIDTDSYTGKWTNITVTFVRANGKCTVNVYVNYAFAATSGAIDFADDKSLANSEKTGYLGIGRGTEISGMTGSNYTDGAFKWYEDNTHTIDNVTLISGAMTAENMLALRNI